RAEPGRPGLHRGRRDHLGAGADGGPRPRRRAHGLPPRRLLAAHGYPEGETSVGSPVAVGRGSLEGLEMSGAWAGRRVFVTGATGIVGWCLVRRLLDEGAMVVALVLDWNPQSELMRSGDV